MVEPGSLGRVSMYAALRVYRVYAFVHLSMYIVVHIENARICVCIYIYVGRHIRIHTPRADINTHTHTCTCICLQQAA